jgi:tetratricopeptide (TPR) repeat protein
VKIMSDTALDDVRALKKKATAFRNRGDFDRAQKMLDSAIATLDELETSTSSSIAQEARLELADTWGMKGGVYRRAGDVNAALKAYERGYELEKKDEVVTYNLSNLIVLNVTALHRSPLDPKIRSAVEEAIKLLEKHTAGARRDEWWAWCDLAQFYFLHEEPEKARAAYVEGKNRTGPRLDELKRYAEVLAELANGVEAIAPQIAESIRKLIGDAIRQ